ncbi:MAG: transposase [Deltaproteobacteria bacterium]|nr:transposase [Deltaproteobacteria bacterium]MBI4374582.1 transposase [Deltaproteobacteria bacterium]
MSRPLRIEYEGATYHLTSRGDGREDIFLSDADQRLFLDLLAETVQRCQWLCHAYCLMSNHYHLLIETPRANLSQGMRHLNGVYTQRFNRRYRRVGHVFQGRYKAIVVQRDVHLLELCRYVVLNPVRARMVKKAENWEWSSYRATVGQETKPAWLTTDWILAQFGRRRSICVKAYGRFVQDGIGHKPWEHLLGQIYYGDDEFVKKLEKGPELLEIPLQQRQPIRIPLNELIKEGTAEELRKAHREHNYQLKEIADRLGVHYSTVSRRLNRNRQKEKIV